MKNDIHFWTATLGRGALALIVGSAVIVIPDMATTLLLLPFALVISILCLATYGVLDSALVFTTSFMASSRRARVALRLQGMVGVICGIVLLAVVYDRIRLHWFLYLIAFQALCVAIAEFVVARHAFPRGTSAWNYAAATVALVFVAAYTLVGIFFRETLLPREIAWLIYGYLVAFGLAECLTASRMLYADQKIAEAHVHGL